MARRTSLLRQSGPYIVESYSQTGTGEVYLKVIPSFPEYGPNWQKTRAAGQGGGPSIITAVALAQAVADLLNGA